MGVNKLPSFVVLGTTEFTLACADAIRRNGGNVITLVTLPEHLKPENSVDFKSYAQRHGINLVEYSDLNSAEAIEHLKLLAVDYIFSTWPHLLSEDFLRVPKKFVIGSHPTPLPIGRGRHALHWLTVLNIRETCLSFFIMDRGIDTGQILFKQNFRVEDQIIDTNQRLIEAADLSFPYVLDSLLNMTLSVIPNDCTDFSNYWRKRDFHDITLDPRMSSQMAIRIVNSFVPPYSGARLYIGAGEYLVIVKVEKVSGDGFLDHWIYREHGYIFESHHDRLVIRFDDAVLSLTVSPTLNRNLSGSKLHPPSLYLCN
jgi:methionyl-tRNA formyltransferase